MDVTDPDALVGRTLGGTYRVERLLGAGGMGAVFVAVHQRTGRRYAVKVLLPEVAARRDALARFEREAHAIGALGHAHIVAVHDFAQSDGLAYLVMDLLEGEDLAARLERRGALPLSEALTVLEQIASGLSAAHEHGLVHRDLKPANIFLARQPGAPERAVLLDFGLAKSFVSEGDLAKLTVSGVVMGTPQYMSPEQAAGQSVDSRADLYALATIFYEMLAGAPPFTAPTLPALFAKLATEPAPSIAVRRPDLPPALSDVIARALAKTPAERPPDVWSLVREVRVAAGSGPVPHTDAHVVTPPGGSVDAHAPTLATPVDTPIGRAAVTPGATPATIRAHPSTPRRWALAVALAALAIVGALAVGVLLVVWPADDERVARTEPVRTEPPRDAETTVVEPVAPEPVEIVSGPPEPTPLAEEPAEESAPSSIAAPRARRSGRASLRPGASGSTSAPSADTAPAPSDTSAPPGSGPPPGVREAVARMQTSDWRGCIRATHASPRSPELLGARMSCAIQARDRDELRSTCAEMSAHYPSHPQTRSCAQILQAYGWN